MSISILGYWDIRGLAEPIRLLLEYGGIPYEDRRYHMDKPAWLEYKPSLGYDFPNLPYFQDEDVKITQSGAIIRHLGRKLNLAGQTEKEKAEVDMMIDVASDYRQASLTLCYSPEFGEELMKAFMDGTGAFVRAGPLEARIQALEKKLGGNDWFVGNKLSVADFVLWELLNGFRLLFSGCFEKFPGMTGFLTRFEELPEIKAYLNNPAYKPFPIWSVRAKYGFYPN